MVAARDIGDAAGRSPVVVVDDDHSVRRAVARLLRSSMLDVETCASAEEYLSSPHLNVVACLILDVHLGAMSGLELLEHLVARGAAPPVIVITAQDSPTVRERARELGAFGYFRKPFDPTSLLDAVRDAVAGDPEQ
jgi:FixJ family two-component response regulator